MSVVMDIYGLIRDLMTEAEKVKDDKLYSSLIDIKKQVNELDEENQRLKKQLDIRDMPYLFVKSSVALNLS